MKYKEVVKLSEKDKKKRIKELKMELVKAKAGKTGSSKIKEIKKIIARIHTSNSLDKTEGITK